jgi:hypothetical protein
MSFHVRVIGLAILLCIGVAGCANDNFATAAAATQPTAAPTALHIHLPGIGGYRNVDRGMLRGLREGGYAERIVVHDWTGSDAGLAALVATQRHKQEATRVAQIIADELAVNPATRITVSAHSAGSGIIAWALEQLPPDAQIDTLLLVAPALAHVRGKVYVLYSPYDNAVLGMGTKMLGTVDGVKAEASGKVGFTPPATADKSLYEAKLVQLPYRSEWIKLGNIGDHIGGLARPFSRGVLAPLLVRGELPGAAPVAAAAPATPAEPLSVPPPLPVAATAPAPATMPAPAEAGQ